MFKNWRNVKALRSFLGDKSQLIRAILLALAQQSRDAEVKKLAEELELSKTTLRNRYGVVYKRGLASFQLSVTWYPFIMWGFFLMQGDREIMDMSLPLS